MDDSDEGWRGASGRVNGENGALFNAQALNGLSGVGQRRGARNHGRVGIRAQLARGARGAMERRLEMAENVVMLEGGRDQEQQVKNDAVENRTFPPRPLERAGHVVR